MSPKARLSFLENSVELLVQHFGVGSVRNALAKVSRRADNVSKSKSARHVEKPDRETNLSVTSTLEQIRERDMEKHRLLSSFYMQLIDKEVLPESQDIRQFAQLFGIKEIVGRSRREMIRKLMRCLFEQPTERLQVDIREAANISEQQRQQGFSVLTDKILGNE